MPEPANPIAALVAILLADAGMAAAVGTRGFGGELPASEAASMPRACFVLRPSGGVSLTGDSYVAHDTRRIDLFTYGPTVRAAGQINDRADLVLRNIRRQVAASTLIHWSQPAGGYVSGREPDTEWPRCFRSYQVLSALEALS